MSRYALGLLGAVAVGLISVSTSVQAQVQAPTLWVDMPAQPLGAALRRLATTAGRQVVYVPDELRGRTAPALRGRLTADEAIGRLLAGSGLQADMSGNVVVIRAVAALAPSADHSTSAADEVREAPPVILEPLVVTALRQPSALRDTPASVSVLSPETMVVAGAPTLLDARHRAPGLQIVTNGTTLQRVVLRGVQSAGEATTGIYYDETPVTGPAGSAADPGASQPTLALVDLDRIEVLRGPQGTLYGSGSMGGTLRVILNSPDAQAFEGHVRVEGMQTEGGAAGHSVSGVLNLPLVRDRLALRTVVYDESRGGYIDNVRYDRTDINRLNTQGARAALAFTPDDRLRLTLTAAHQTSRYEDSIGYWNPALGVHKTDSNVIGEHGDELRLYSGVLIWRMPLATLTASASRYNWDRLTSSDYTPTLALGVENSGACTAYFALATPCDADQFQLYQAYARSRLPGAWRQDSTLRSESREVRLQSNDAGPFDWTLGHYAESRRDHFDSHVFRADPATGRVLVDQSDVTGYRFIDNAVTQSAVFGEVSWSIAPVLTLNVGARRYAYDTSVAGEVVTPNHLTGSSLTDYERSATSAKGLVRRYGLSYQAAPDTLVYVTFAEGFRPGGVNNVPGAGSILPATYAPDRLWSHEAGVRASWFNERVTLHGAAYQIDWRDMLISTATPNGAWRYLTNAGAARIRGLEFEMRARVMRRLVLDLHGTLMDARLVEDQGNGHVGALAAAGREGDRIPFTPRRAFSASAAYAREVSLGTFLTRVEYSYTGASASEFRPSHANYEVQSSYELVNAMIGLETSRYVLSLSATNLMDAVAPLRVISSNNGVRSQTVSAAPRTIILGLNVKF